MSRAHKKLAALAVFFTLVLFAASAGLPAGAMEKIDEFMTMRMMLSVLESRDEAVGQIRAFEKSSVESVRSAYGEESALVLENLIIAEIFNYYFDNPPVSREEFRKMLADQKAKDDAYIASRADGQFSAWFWATSGDVYSCWTTFSIKDILRYGLTIKKYYLSAYETDASCSIALTALGQWYLQAPKVGGGSKSKAREYFTAARASSRTDAEKYYADIFLSQFLFEQKEYDECAALLSEAERLNPASRYIALIRAQNAAGLSLYQYNRKRSNAD